MQKTVFQPHSPGWLNEIPPFMGVSVAFNPDPLPPAWEFPIHLWPKLNEAGKQLMLLEGISRMLPDAPSILMRPLQNREAILSSRMEGTFATARELLLFELNPGDASSDDSNRNQHREVANYASALDLAAQSPLPLSLTLLKQIHGVLLDGVRGESKEPGKFRTKQVGIGAFGSVPRFVPPPPDRLQDYLEELDTYLQQEGFKYDPLVECFLVHYQLETIHPFADGNGRVGRLLLTLMVKRLCGMTHPWLHMSEYFERDHSDYCDRMYRVSTEGGWEKWIDYCLDGVVWLVPRIVDRCQRLMALRSEYHSKLSSNRGSSRLLQIVDQLFHGPFVVVAELPEKLKVTYPTAKSDVEKLVDIGILAEYPEKYPKTYYAPEIFNIAYEGLE